MFRNIKLKSSQPFQNLSLMRSGGKIGARARAIGARARTAARARSRARAKARSAKSDSRDNAPPPPPRKQTLFQFLFGAWPCVKIMHVEGLVVNPPVWDRLKWPNLIRPFRWPLPRTPNPIPWRRSSQGDNRPGSFRPFHQTGSGQAPEQLQSSLGVLLGFRVFDYTVSSRGCNGILSAGCFGVRFGVRSGRSVVDNSVPTD